MARDVNVAVDAGARGEDIALGRYALGQGGLSHEGIIAPHVAALKWLRPKVIRLFVQEYYHVYPEPGVYNWAELDADIDSILATGAKPLISICVKPKVLFPEVDHDKNVPTSWQEWEDLIEAMVRHYNVERGDGIEYWEVFNEPDIGESGGCPGRFTPEGYCEYYDHTVSAIRRADPSAKVGGPALADWEDPIRDALIEYCAGGRAPLDFVSWHRYTDDPEFYSMSTRKVKEVLAKHPGLECETIIDEWNISLGWENTSHAFQPCYIAESVRRMREAGLDLSCYYHIRDYHVSPERFARFMSPEGTRFMTYWWNVMPQFHGIFDYQGRMRPSYFIWKCLSHIRGAMLDVESGGETVNGLSAYDEEFEVVHVMLWNFAAERPEAQNVKLSIDGLDGKKWRYYRRMFDAETASNDENDRLRLAEIKSIGEEGRVEDEFELEPYGITFIAIKKFE